MSRAAKRPEAGSGFVRHQHALHHRFRLLSRGWAGGPVPGLPDWLESTSIEGLALALPGDGEPGGITVAVRHGIPLKSLPAQWRPHAAFEPIRLRAVRAPRPVLQFAPSLRPASRPGRVGTATALLRALEGGASYLLTCAHVAVPTLEGAFGEQVAVSHDAVAGQARVVDWRPAPGAGPSHSTLDAALLAIDDPLLQQLRLHGDLLPAGVGDRPRAGQAVTLRSHRAHLPGRLKVYWSGPVDVPGLTPGQADYILQEAIGYRCSSQGGDSGAAVWDDQDRLMGMHIAGIDATGPDEANALYGPIQPVLQTFRATPWLRPGEPMPAQQAPAPSLFARGNRIRSAPSIDNEMLSEREVVACTMWGEARNQGEAGLRAVACVIHNRLRTGYRGRTSARAVCLDPWQFSCWLDDDPNLPRMLAAARQPDAAWRMAEPIAQALLQGTLQDVTHGARHYYAITLRQAPRWARGKHPCAVIGDHLFFNDID